ncbi:MAG: helix-turn-helix transcriptional regulator [Polyangiales bacterium]
MDDLVRRTRRAHGISQRRLAALAGVPRSTIERIENGATIPSLCIARALSAKLGVDALCIRRECALSNRLGRAVDMLVEGGDVADLEALQLPASIHMRFDRYRAGTQNLRRALESVHASQRALSACYPRFGRADSAALLCEELLRVRDAGERAAAAMSCFADERSELDRANAELIARLMQRDVTGNDWNVIRQRRLERGWSQQDLAIASGVSRSTIRRLESRKTVASNPTVAKLARALDLAHGTVRARCDLIVAIERITTLAQERDPPRYMLRWLPEPQRRVVEQFCAARRASHEATASLDRFASEVLASFSEAVLCLRDGTDASRFPNKIAEMAPLFRGYEGASARSFEARGAVLAATGELMMLRLRCI